MHVNAARGISINTQTQYLLIVRITHLSLGDALMTSKMADTDYWGNDFNLQNSLTPPDGAVVNLKRPQQLGSLTAKKITVIRQRQLGDVSGETGLDDGQ